MSDSTFLNRLVVTLEIHLYIILQQDISSTLGTKALFEALTYLGNLLVAKKYYTTTLKLAPIISQDLLKNKEVKPSGLEDLSSRIKNKASLISTSITSAIKLSYMCFEIHLKKYLEASLIGGRVG